MKFLVDTNLDPLAKILHATETTSREPTTSSRNQIFKEILASSGAEVSLRCNSCVQFRRESLRLAGRQGATLHEGRRERKTWYSMVTSQWRSYTLFYWWLPVTFLLTGTLMRPPTCGYYYKCFYFLWWLWQASCFWSPLEGRRCNSREIFSPFSRGWLGDISYIGWCICGVFFPL